VGGAHSCALLDDGSVKCWGGNEVGQLGLGDSVSRGNEASMMGDALPAVDLGSGRSALRIVAGTEHTCALIDDGSAKCWGANLSGQLGLGDQRARGDEPGEMGDALSAVDLGSNSSVLALSAGRSHTCVLLDDRRIKCWGENYYGELGLGDRDNRGDEPGEMGDALPAVSLW